MFEKINSHNEWDKLKEIIVGSAEGTRATLTWNKPGKIPEKLLQEAIKLAEEATPKWLYDEVCEDLDELSKTLKNLGVTVHRPKTYDFKKMYSSPYWSSTSNNVYNARDLNLVVGNSVIESPSYLINRYYETRNEKYKNQ